jgi:hypothetical protein
VFKRGKSEEKAPLARPARLLRVCGPAGSHLELMTMRSRKDYITYREWRERGETVFGAASRTVPFQYVWAVVALLVLLAVMYLKPLVKLLLS